MGILIYNIKPIDFITDILP
ncbi:hypothetical protein [Pedobacter agri]